MNSRYSLLLVVALASLCQAFPEGPVEGWNLEKIESGDDIALAHRKYAQQFDKPTTPARRRAFMDNLVFIKQQNKLAKGYRLGLTEFADLTWSEFKSMYLEDEHALADQLARECTRGACAEFSGQVSSEGAKETVDWLKAGYVTKVKSQGNCGSCWSFATVAMLEALAKDKVNKLVDLSTQELISCEPNRGGIKACAGGGTSLWAAQYAIKNGIMTEGSYPYQCKDKNSQECLRALSTCSRVADQSLKLISKAWYTRGENALVSALQKRPAVVAINSDRAWQHYTGGILDSSTCSSSPAMTNHLVTVVGYDKDRLAIKNSWGSSWGKRGFAMLKRGVNACGVDNWILNAE